MTRLRFPPFPWLLGGFALGLALPAAVLFEPRPEDPRPSLSGLLPGDTPPLAALPAGDADLGLGDLLADRLDGVGKCRDRVLGGAHEAVRTTEGEVVPGHMRTAA
jgi:hypothetical protein